MQSVYYYHQYYIWFVLQYISPNESVQHLEISFAWYQKTGLRVLSHNHILSLASSALQHPSVLRPRHANCSLLSVPIERGACAQAACMRRDKPSHGADSLWASSDRQHIVRVGWEWSLIQSEKWHNNEINTNTVASLTPCGEGQQSRTCFHFLLALTATMFFWHTRAHVYSTCCSLVRSSARGPFAL